MGAGPERVTADLTAYPDLIVIYLGMRANSIRGFITLAGFGPKVSKAVAADPDGLLLHENVFYSFLPLHVGMRQYWRDFDALERWARAGVHADWWIGFLGDPKGAGFWHETYARDGLIESVYIDMPPIGLAKLAPTEAARGSMFSARRRLGLEDAGHSQPVVAERDLYNR